MAPTTKTIDLHGQQVELTSHEDHKSEHFAHTVKFTLEGSFTFVYPHDFEGDDSIDASQLDVMSDVIGALSCLHDETIGNLTIVKVESKTKDV